MKGGQQLFATCLMFSLQCDDLREACQSSCVEFVKSTHSGSEAGVATCSWMSASSNLCS